MHNKTRVERVLIGLYNNREHSETKSPKNEDRSVYSFPARDSDEWLHPTQQFSQQDESSKSLAKQQFLGCAPSSCGRTYDAGAQQRWTIVYRYLKECNDQTIQVAFSTQEVSLMNESQPPSIPPGVAAPLPLELVPAMKVRFLENSVMAPS